MKTVLLRGYRNIIIWSALIFSPLFYFLCCVIPEKTDYAIHLRLTQKLSVDGIHSLPAHFLYQVLVFLFHTITQLSFNWSGLIVVLLFEIALAVVIYRELN